MRHGRLWASSFRARGVLHKSRAIRSGIGSFLLTQMHHSEQKHLAGVHHDVVDRTEL